MDFQDVFRQIDEATDLAEQLLGDRAKAINWMMSPQEALFGEIPRIMIIAGDGEDVMRWLRSRI